MARSDLAILVMVAATAGAPLTAYAQRGGEAPVARSGETITLAVGESKTISAKDVRNYSEGAPGIIDVRLTTDASRFIITGSRPGSTTLLFIKNDGSQVNVSVDVFARSPEAVEKELTQLLEGLPNVRVRRVGAHIVIDGTVSDETEQRRVQHVASLYPGEVDSLVTVGVAPVVGVPAAGGQPGEPPRFIIRIDFYFVQYDVNSSYSVGISWPGTIGGPVLQSQFTYDFLLGVPRTATASLASQPLPGLDIASTRGWAKVLRQATIITNNGTEATFSNGGEQNYTVTTGLGVGVQRIPFGTDVTVLPKYQPALRQIDVRLTADVADLTASSSGTNLPGRATSKLVTNISLKLGESLILSGIRSQSTTHAVGGLPVLKDIPVLGLLFGAHSDQTQTTEGAIFIVPSVIEPVPNSARELVSSALATFQDFSGNIESVGVMRRLPASDKPAPGK
jgi:pilus assembly protein CpaC